MAKQNKPAIRFKGFTDAWEQRKLGEVFEEYSEKNHEELPPLTIIQGGGTIRRDESERSLQYDKSSLSNYKMVNKDDFIVHLRSFEGGLEKANSQGIISPAYHTFHGENVDSRFYYAYFRSKNFINKDLKPHVYGIRDGRSIDIEGMKTIKIPYTAYAEQKSIGDFLTALDNLITLHQRKYDKLQVLKKAMLEKMFPKNGCSVPEIRFKGFTDAWEQRKLSEIAGKVTEKNTGLQYVETLTNSAEFGIISQRDFFDHDISKLGSLDGYYIVRNEDFVYNPRISTSAPVGPINRNKLGRTGVMSPLYTVFRPHDIDTTYLEHFFKCGYWYSFMNFNGDSGARSDRFSIKDDVFFQMPIPVPHIEEQRKIGLFLTQLDHLITLHQRELEKLQNIKKSMLEKMFV